MNIKRFLWLFLLCMPCLTFCTATEDGPKGSQENVADESSDDSIMSRSEALQWYLFSEGVSFEMVLGNRRLSDFEESCEKSKKGKTGFCDTPACRRFDEMRLRLEGNRQLLQANLNKRR